MKRLGLIPCLGALLALPGCIVTYDLGETAEESSGGSGDGSGSTDGTSVGTNPDPSATSGQPPGTTTFEEGSATATAGESGDETGEAEPGCDAAVEHMTWRLGLAPQAPIEGIDVAFGAVLQGDCTVGEMVVMVPEDFGDPIARIPLECSLAGWLDGDSTFLGAMSPVLELTGTIDFEEVAQVLGQDLHVKLALDWWGMGWSGWFVLEHPTTGVALLDLVSAEYLDPIDSSLGGQVGEILDTPWRPHLTVSTQDDPCALTPGQCNEVQRRLQFGLGRDTLALSERQADTLSDEELFLLYHTSVTWSRDVSEPTCTDTPLGIYVLASRLLPQ
jgi:hypothetical protein